MEHIKKCLAAMEQQQIDADRIIDRDFARMKAAGIDTSMRGIGYTLRCICDETQENSECQ